MSTVYIIIKTRIIMQEELVKGDCLEYMAGLKNESIDLVVTDPPYLIDYKTGRRKTQKRVNVYSDPDAGKDIIHKFETTIDGDNDPELISKYIAECYRIMKNNTAMYMFCNSNKIDFFVSELEKFFTLRNIIVWVKNNHTAGDLKFAFGKKHEFIILVNKGEAKIRGKRIQDVWKFSKDLGSLTLHQNQKPVALIQQCIEKHSDEKEVVFDGFGGSGTTAIAARNAKRSFIVIEKDDEYFNVAFKRLNHGDQDCIDW